MSDSIADMLGSLFHGRSTLGVLLILSFLVVILNHFIPLGLLFYLALFVFVVCFLLWLAYNVFNLSNR